jgi:Uma2 family endonuclease
VRGRSSASGRTTAESNGRQTFGYAEDVSEPGVKVRMSYAEYLSAEAQSEVKHQFVDGEMFAMAGGTRRHAYLQTRVVVALGNALRDRPCVPYGSELRVYLPALGEGTYPDASVVCGRFLRASEDPEATVNPAALVEVLSPTTEAYDRGRKFEKYQTLPSVREYLLVSQDRPRVERYVRGDDGSWIWRAYGAGERVPLACAGVDLAVDDLYAGAFNADDDAAPTA